MLTSERLPGYLYFKCVVRVERLRSQLDGRIRVNTALLEYEDVNGVVYRKTVETLDTTPVYPLVTTHREMNSDAVRFQWQNTDALNKYTSAKSKRRK